MSASVVRATPFHRRLSRPPRVSGCAFLELPLWYDGPWQYNLNQDASAMLDDQLNKVGRALLGIVPGQQFEPLNGACNGGYSAKVFTNNHERKYIP
jgi:hypothetical protein